MNAIGPQTVMASAGCQTDVMTLAEQLKISHELYYHRTGKAMTVTSVSRIAHV